MRIDRANDRLRDDRDRPRCSRWRSPDPPCARRSRAAARGRGARGRDAETADAPAVSPAEIQRMFDSYALIQAQDQLKITDEKFPQFLRALQGAAGHPAPQHEGALPASCRICGGSRTTPQPDEAQMRDRLKALDELDARAQAEIAKAYEAINQVLDVRQQAKFRVFEENMENRKLALVTRARQANRPKQ